MASNGLYSLYTDSEFHVLRFHSATREADVLPFKDGDADYVISGNGRYVFDANKNGPANLYRLDMDTGVSDLLLTLDGSVLEWHLTTDDRGLKVAFRSFGNLTGSNPQGSDQVYLLTLVPEPSDRQLAVIAAVCGVIVVAFRRSKSRYWAWRVAGRYNSAESVRPTQQMSLQALRGTLWFRFVVSLALSSSWS